MAREARVNIVNKSSSVATVTYTNWDAVPSTSRSVVVPAGSSMITYNTWELDDFSQPAATSANIFNLPLQDGNPLTKILIQDFAYDKTKLSVTLSSDIQV